MKALKEYEQEEQKIENEIRKQYGNSLIVNTEGDSEEEWAKFGKITEKYNREHENERLK